MRLPIIRDSPRSSATMASSTPRRREHLGAGITFCAGANDHTCCLGLEHVVELAESERNHHLVRLTVADGGAKRLLGRLRREHGQLRDIGVEDRASAIEQEHDRRLELAPGKSIDGADQELGGLVVVALAHPGAVRHQDGERDHASGTSA